MTFKREAQLETPSFFPKLPEVLKIGKNIVFHLSISFREGNPNSCTTREMKVKLYADVNRICHGSVSQALHKV